MSTVSDIYSILQYRRDIQPNSDDLIHLVNQAIRTISKRLYSRGSNLIIGRMSVNVFAEAKTRELLTLDVEPATAWSVGDTITGVTSEETCVITAIITTKTFYVKERSGAFTLDEVLTNGTYTADQGAANPTFTSEMAIVDSGPDTITYTGAQFIVEGFKAGMAITTTHASNPGPFRIATVAAGTLTLASTDSVVADTATSFIITSDDAYGFLPDDFWGLADKPYLDGYYDPLYPLPAIEAELNHPSPGFPLYYRILGSKIYVTPHTGDDYTIIGDYYQRPASMTSSTSTVPFNELFDDLVAEYVEVAFRGETEKGGDAIQILEKMVREGVDLVAQRYDRNAPAYAPQAIAW